MANPRAEGSMDSLGIIKLSPADIEHLEHAAYYGCFMCANKLVMHCSLGFCGTGCAVVPSLEQAAGQGKNLFVFVDHG